MNKLFDICNEVNDEFKLQQNELDKQKLKRLAQKMKENGIPLIEGSPNAYHASSYYTFAVNYLDSEGSLYLSDGYLNYHDIF